jgi:RNA polymerase sigma factor (sigma-70 family)
MSFVPDEFRYTTDMAVYDAVGKMHNDLSGRDRMLVIQQLESALDRYEYEALQVYAVRVYLYNVYNDKIRGCKSVSTFSRDFNMSIRGHNADLITVVDALIAEAFSLDMSGKHEDASKVILSIRLRHSVLYGAEVLHRVKACAAYGNVHSKAALDQMYWVNKYRETLFESVIKLATHIGKKAAVCLSGEVIAEADLIHEAILGAKEAVLSYQPRNDGKTFTSYVNNWVSGTISKYVNENTRTVSVPRTLIDRYRPVLEAIEELGTTEGEPVALMATKILHDKRQLSRGTKLRREEVYTAREVFNLHQIMQESASLDVEVNSERTEDPTTLGERLVSTAPSQDEQFDSAMVSRTLMGVVRDYSSPEEYTLMELRWGMGKFMGLKQTAEIYRRNTGRPMNKGKVAEIEKDVLARMRDGIEAGDNRLYELSEVLSDE